MRRKKRQTARGGMTRRDLVKYVAVGGVAGLTVGLGVGWRVRRRPRQPRQPNIILISLDTTRRDRLGCYACERPTSPNLDGLAADSVLYTRAIAPSNWTLPSHASLFTGKFTTSHGARFDPQGPLCLAGQLAGSQEFWSHFRARGLSPEEPTLAGILKEAGYATGAVVAGPWLKRAFGLHKGFDYYDDLQIGTENGRVASHVTPAALRWIEQCRAKEFFLFINYFDPHKPYFPPDGFAYRFLSEGTQVAGPETKNRTLRELRDLYDAEILYMDHHIGLLLDGLKQLDLYDNTWIITAADHGEMLGEHGRVGHCHRLYQEEIHIPQFIKYPHGEVPPGRTDVPVQLTDILPTILHRLDIPNPEGIQGGLPPDIGHPIVAEMYSLEFGRKDGDSRAIFDGDFKYVWNSKGDHALYNLGDDPREEVNLVDKHPQQAKAMESQLNTYLASLPRPRSPGPQKILDEETQRALKSLGYLE